MQKVIFVRIHQGLPTGVDDIGADADGPKILAGSVVAVAPALDHHSHVGGGFILGIDHPHLVIRQMDARYFREVVLKRFPQSAIQGIDRAIAFGHAMLDLLAGAVPSCLSTVTR